MDTGTRAGIQASTFWPLWKIRFFGVDRAANKSRYDAIECCKFAEYFASEARQQTAKEIAQKLRIRAEELRTEHNYFGAEALEDAAQLIEREYEVK